MSHHLTREQIDRYTTRSGNADDILTIAAHLEECSDCRDAVAAIVDPGIGERPHRWRSRNEWNSTQITARAPVAEQPERDAPRRFSILPWVLIAILVIATAVVVAAMH